MTTKPEPHMINDLAALEALFGEVGEVSIRKEVSYLHPSYQAMIAASPFTVLATVGPDGLDVSPRGDPPGFMHVQNEHTLLMPERQGNNRIDSLRNIVADPRVALFLLIPGNGETLRINGRARISTSPVLLQRFAMGEKLPKCVLVISVETVFFQCARAIHRSKLWEGLPDEIRKSVPTAGSIVEALTDADIDGAAYDSDLPGRIKSTLY
ncbi:MAG: pyridoxamine 5'-phosphate oxidase family protein [Chloroflexi bacterium]|nr:pyridoxamine 5'-phosphate oxidase family protein [Chloroflexota bacterium]